MEREVKNKAASIRAKLMNIARAEKIDFDFLLLRYFQERFLYRLAISEFSDRFILKGGLWIEYRFTKYPGGYKSWRCTFIKNNIM